VAEPVLHRPQALPHSDGDGWQRCDLGHHHWGRFGAAGLLVVAAGRVLLQHRAPWSHQGDTWGVPGGARGSKETAEQAALREAGEETGLDPALVRLTGTWLDDHGGWSYTTVVAAAPAPLDVHAEDRESTAVRWVPVDEVAGLPLHPGFAASWPALQPLLLL
jgi:8-oxo-dGTP diphosphatase